MSKANVGFLSQCREEIEEVLLALDTLKGQKQEQFNGLKDAYQGQPNYKEFQQLCDRYKKSLQWYEELKVLIDETLASKQLQAEAPSEPEPAIAARPSSIYEFNLEYWLHLALNGSNKAESPWGFIFLQESKKKITLSLQGGSKKKRFCVIDPILESEYLNQVFSTIDYEELKNKELDYLYKHSPTVDFLSFELVELSHSRWDTELMTMLIDKMFVEGEPIFVAKALDKFLIQKDFKGHPKAIEQLRDALVPPEKNKKKV